jgi:hypothetical protein
VYIYEVCTVALESTYEYYRITTDYPLCSLWRYFNRLFALVTIRSDLSGITRTDFPMCTTLSSDTTTNYPLYSPCPYSNRLSAALPCLSILQLTIRSTDYPLCSLWRYSNRLSAVSFLVWQYYNRVSTLLCLSILVQPTIRSALSVDTTIDYPLCSTLLCLSIL